MKLCKDCLYFETNRMYRGCTFDPDHGKRVIDYTFGNHHVTPKRRPGYVDGSDYENRNSNGRCGPEARWFEPRALPTPASPEETR